MLLPKYLFLAGGAISWLLLSPAGLADCYLWSGCCTITGTDQFHGVLMVSARC